MLVYASFIEKTRRTTMLVNLSDLRAKRRAAQRAAPVDMYGGSGGSGGGGYAPMDISDSSEWDGTIYYGGRSLNPNIEQKKNSGTEEDWSKITSKQLVFRSLESIPRADDDVSMYNRDELYAYFGVRPGIPCFLYKNERSNDNLAVIASNRSPLNTNFESRRLVTVKMWGFAGMTAAENMFQLYDQAINQLLMDQTILLADDVVLHYDGDAAYEKSGGKFSHNFFAPYVAQKIKKGMRARGKDAQVHLLITKVDKLKEGETVKNIFAKFCDVDDPFGGAFIRSIPTEGKHSYPLHDYSSFESLAIAVMAPIESGPTEAQNQRMVEGLLQNKIKNRYCLCVGGNTEGGVKSMQASVEANQVGKFDMTVRMEAYAYK